MRRRLECELLLALEVMEEAALGQAGGAADVVDSSRRIALGADDLYRRIEQLRLRLVRCRFGGHEFTYQLVGMQSSGSISSRSNFDQMDRRVVHHCFYGPVDGAARTLNSRCTPRTIARNL